MYTYPQSIKRSLIRRGLDDADDDDDQRLPKRKGGEWRMGADAYMHEAMNAVTRTIYRRNHGVQSTPQLADVIIALL